ncbi:MAG: Nif3-like dinuclear metal center hexameric protein [Cyclobacteriaceae bacterium]|nr:Nif3-like dinuclear metal center hexameric protein [Cyclobacteriaceae bacterium]
MDKIKDIIAHLEKWAPPALQESYDNSGLLTGNMETKINGALITLDCTEAVVEEAIEHNCNLIITHHPIIFSGLKSLTGRTYIERSIIKAIKNDVAIYAIHTNLDNTNTGVNRKICEKMGLKNLSILSPKKQTQKKLITYIPEPDTEQVMKAIHLAGAGTIGEYTQCSFQIKGKGTFKPSVHADPHIGRKEQLEYVDENRVEVIFPAFREKAIIKALNESHPYEEVAYFISPVDNDNPLYGAGMSGELEKALAPLEFLQYLKEQMGLVIIRHTPLPKNKIKKIAVCGGSGSFLLGKAISSGADAFVSADFKYHEFFDAENKILIADIGHYESEIYTKDLIHDYLCEKFTTFAVVLSKVITNPISYF